MSSGKISVGIDWLSYTVPVGTNLQKLFDASECTESWGRLGYDTAVETLTGILVLQSSTRDDMGIHVICSGKALIAELDHEQRDPMTMLQSVLLCGGSVTRLDVFVDVKDGQFSIEELAYDYRLGNVETTSKSCVEIKSITDEGHTIYVGKRGSRKMLRVYDKAAEQGEPGDWVRIELELRRDAAQSIAGSLLAERLRWKGIIQGAIMGFVDFTMSPSWATALGSNRTTTAIPEKPKSKTREWLINVCAKATARLLLRGDSAIVADFIASVDGFVSDES